MLNKNKIFGKINSIKVKNIYENYLYKTGENVKTYYKFMQVFYKNLSEFNSYQLYFLQ